MALATSNISASVPVPLMAFTAQRTNRVLSWVYPRLLSILSRLADLIRSFMVPVPMANGIWVISHFPVHTRLAHSSVRSHEMFRSLDRKTADLMIKRHGVSFRV